MSPGVHPPHPPVVPTFTVPLPPPAPPAALEWAKRYAARGLPPIAIRPADKRPLAAGWQVVTLDDTCALLTANPGANVGIAVPNGLLVLDVDVKGDGHATLAAFEIQHGPLPATLRATTQSGGAHFWFKVPAGADVPNAVGFAPGLDTRSAGKGYVLAEPSVFEGRPYRWENWNAEIADAPEWLLGVIAAGKPTPSKASEDGEPPRIAEGRRNGALAERASTMRREGFSSAVIRVAISALNRESCHPPVDIAEVDTIVNSISKHARGAVPHEVFGDGGALPPGAILHEPSETQWAVVSLDPPASAFEPLPHIVDRWIPQGEVTLLAGHGGDGKSYVALRLAVHVALGRPFGALSVRKSKVLFYSAEDDAHVLQRRLLRLYRDLGVSPDDVQGRLFVLDASNHNPALFRKGPTPALEGLRASVEEHGVDLVIIDNGSEVFEGDEIKRAEVRGFMRALRSRLARPGRAVLLLVHIDKNSARRGGGGDSEDYSGSTAWHNSARSRLSLKRGPNDSLTIEHAKANHGPKANPVQLHWHEHVPMISNTGPIDHDALAEQRELWKQALLGSIAAIEGLGDHVPVTKNGPASAFITMGRHATYPADIDKEKLYRLLDEMQTEGRIHRKLKKTANRKEVEVYSCEE